MTQNIILEMSETIIQKPFEMSVCSDHSSAKSMRRNKDARRGKMNFIKHQEMFWNIVSVRHAAAVIMSTICGNLNYDMDKEVNSRIIHSKFL